MRRHRLLLTVGVSTVALVALNHAATRAIWHLAEVDMLLQGVGMGVIVLAFWDLSHPRRVQGALVESVLGIYVCAIGTTRGFFWSFSIMGGARPSYVLLRLSHTLLAGMLVPWIVFVIVLGLSFRRPCSASTMRWVMCLLAVLFIDMLVLMALFIGCLSSINRLL
ncbi:MAG: hypothetical protein RBS80_17600 [Thermoguttaceae bacterium]|jgi:hypothetical protein|nr:hypothetical protein [Thermoguttaceae bacterium]